MEKKGSICGLVTGPKNGIQELLEMLFYNTPPCRLSSPSKKKIDRD
jgi:hypothetical protein